MSVSNATDFDESGLHPDILQTVQSLDKVRNKHLATADRFRKLHLQNVQQLYEYEVTEAEAMFKVNSVSRYAKGGLTYGHVL